MSEAVQEVRVAGGRAVVVHDLSGPGPGDRRTVMFCHAAPGAGSFDPDPAATRRRGIRLLAQDRSGYGRSEPPRSGEWASVDRAAEDIAEVLAARGIERVAAAGWSGGGRVALALAARHPELVERVAVIATPAPNDEVAWVPPEQQAGLDSLRGQAPEAVHAALGEMLGGLVPPDPRSSEAIGLIGGGPADEPVLATDGVRDRLGEMFAIAFEQGAAGLAADIAGYGIRPWGFEPADVRAKVLLVYGGADAIGSRHGRWWQRQLPNARLEMVPGAGHLVVVPMWGRVLSFLAPSR